MKVTVKIVKEKKKLIFTYSYISPVMLGQSVRVIIMISTLGGACCYATAGPANESHEQWGTRAKGYIYFFESARRVHR